MVQGGSILSTKLYCMWSMIFGCQPRERLMFLPCNSSRILHDSTRAMDVIKLLNLLKLEPNLSRWEMTKLMGFSCNCVIFQLYIYGGCVAMIGPPTHYFSGGHPNNWVWIQILGLLSLFWCGCWLYSHQNSGWPTKLIRQNPCQLQSAIEGSWLLLNHCHASSP